MDYKFRLRDGRSSSPVRLTRQTAHSVEIIREEDGKGKLGGFGFTLLYEKPPIVGTITPNSPAERAGLKCKDVIISVNDIPVEDLTHKEVVKLIENTPSTGVWLTVREPDSNSETPDGFSGVIKKQGSISVPGLSPEDYISRSRSSSFTGFNPNRSYPRQHSPSPPTSHRRQRSFDEMRRVSDTGRMSSPSKLTVTSRVPSATSLGTSSPRSGSLPRAPLRATVLVQYIGPVEMPQKWSTRGMSSRCIRECTRRIVTERREYNPLEVYLDLGLNGLKLLNSNKNTLVHYGRKELYYCGVHLEDDHYFGIVTRHSKLIDEMGQSVPTVMSETTHPKTVHRCHVFCILPLERNTEMQVQYSGTGNMNQHTRVSNAHAIVQVIRDIYNQEMVLDSKPRPLSNSSQELKVPDFGHSGASVSSEGSSTSSLSNVSGGSHDLTPQSKKKHVVDLTPRVGGSFDFEDGKFSRHRESLERRLLDFKAAQTPERDICSSSLSQLSMPKWTPSPESFKHHRYEDIDRFPNLVSKRDSFSSSNWSGPSGGSEAYFQVTDTQPPPGPVYATVNKPKPPPLVRQSSDSSLRLPPDTPGIGAVDSKASEMPAKNGPMSSSMTSLWSTTTAGEEPQGRVAGWAASFDRLLQDPLGLRYFMTFLKQEHSEENLLFWLACDEFKKTVAAIPSMLQPSSEKLYNDFVDPVLSVQEVNIDDNHRKDLEAKLKSPSGDMFDEAQHQVYRLMRMDSFPRFTRSGMFKELLVQDLDGKQLPVLDITPIVPPQESIPVQDVSSDLVKTRVTRANSTKERHWSLFGRKVRTDSDVQHDDDKRKKEFKRKGSKKEPPQHQPVDQQHSLPQDEDEQGHRQWLSEQNNVFEIVLSSTVTKLVPVPKSGTVREAIAPLLSRQKFSFETVDIKSAASLQLIDLDMPANTLSNQHLVVIQRPDTFVVTLPDTELLLPADEHKSARDICGPALAKEGLDPNNVVLYVFGSRVPLDLNIPGYLLKNQKVVAKISATSSGQTTGAVSSPRDTNSNNMNEDTQEMKSSSAADMDNLFNMLMRVQGDTLEEQRSAEPTPEPLNANRESPLVASSKSSSTSGSIHRETPSPYKSELVQGPASRTKRRILGHDDVDHTNINSPLQSQSDSAPSVNLSSNSPIPSSSPATLSQEYDPQDGKHQNNSRPGSRNSFTSMPQNDTGQYMSELRNKNISPSLDKARVRHELAQWAVKGKGGENAMYQPVNGKVPLQPRAATSGTVVTRYQQPQSPSPLPALSRIDHHRAAEVNRQHSHSPTPPLGSPAANSTISYQSTLDSWVMHADGKSIPELPHSPPVRYQTEAALSPSLIQNNRARHMAYQPAQPAYQTSQGWKVQPQNVLPVTTHQPGAIPGRHYSQGRPQVADDRNLLMAGDRLLRKELEEIRAEQQQNYLHYPSATGVAPNQALPQHRQLTISPPNSASSIISNSTIPSTIGQQKQYMIIPGGNTHETRV